MCIKAHRSVGSNLLPFEAEQARAFGVSRGTACAAAVVARRTACDHVGHPIEYAKLLYRAYPYWSPGRLAGHDECRQPASPASLLR